MNTFIGIDLGTSSVKLLLTDRDGNVLNSASRSYPVSYPKDGWSEQNPDDWFKAVCDGLEELLNGQDKSAVRGIGAGGQMHGLVVLDEKNEVIRPCILWNDGRTQSEVDYLNGKIGKKKLSKNLANVAFAGFTLPKILWLKENEPQNFKRIKKIMLPKDYLNFMLCGEFSSDYSDASGTLLLDVKNRKWSDFACKIAGIDKEVLPTLYHSYEKVSTVKKEIAQRFGLNEDVIVCAGAGDNASASVGTGTVFDGDCNISLGTSGTVFISRDKFSVDGKNALHSFAHANGAYHLMGCILSAASCNAWWSAVAGVKDFDEEQKNLERKLGKNGVYFLPYLMGERSPHNDVNAKSAFIGMRPDTSRQDMSLAVLEGVAFALKDCVEEARALGAVIDKTRLCGGGAKSALWRKIIANVLNVKVEIPAVEEGPAYGACILSMVACGEYPTVQEATKKIVKIKSFIEPDENTVKLYKEKYLTFKKLYPALKQVFN
ncbi:MAG: xylulokinase [Clostridia bacterium]|nr:xylulokinase [Clostridia bacterium]